MAMQQFGGIQHIPQFSNLSVVTCEYELMDIDVAVVGRASEFWKACKSRLTSPLYFRDDQEWFSVEFGVWWDTKDPGFVLDLSSPVSAKLSLPTDVLKVYTLEFEIRVKRALTDVRNA